MSKSTIFFIGGILTISGCISAPQGEPIRFTQKVDVFGVRVIATHSVPQEKLLHAANVLAEYLDNDEDGQPDNISVLQAMIQNRATLVMAYDPEEIQWLNPDHLNTQYAQDLYATEVHPMGAAKGHFDGALEEVLHLISFAGYEAAYPDTFSSTPGTPVAKAMDAARGGHFKQVPRYYPDSAWYSYNDQTCNYKCQVGEYIYWGLTSMLGAQDYPWRKNEIADEWRLATPTAFKNTDQQLYALLTDPRYRFPTRLPDGVYTAHSLRIETIKRKILSE
ncbi:MAG: hypothetical protein OIF55_05415 [Amphritea sp.]|nr:hypothetical protein [Amphritea sp.]